MSLLLFVGSVFCMIHNTHANIRQKTFDIIVITVTVSQHYCSFKIIRQLISQLQALLGFRQNWSSPTAQVQLVRTVPQEAITALWPLHSDHQPTGGDQLNHP